MREPPVKQGQRIRLIKMGADDPCPIEPGAIGEVIIPPAWFQNAWNITVKWDNGRGLNLVSPPDLFEVIEPGETGEVDPINLAQGGDGKVFQP